MLVLPIPTTQQVVIWRLLLRATAITSLEQSLMLVAMATTGVVRLVVLTLAPVSSVAALLMLVAIPGPAASLYVALRINPMIRVAPGSFYFERMEKL